MWISIAKLEFKKGFVYYFLLYLFFFFWSIFTLFGFFLYDNLASLNKNYLKKIGVSILVYPQENTNIENIKNILKKIEYIANVEIYPPQKVYNEIEKDLPEGFIKNEEIEKIFPYLIKLSFKSVSDLSRIKKDLDLLQEVSVNKFEVILEPGFKYLFFIKYFHYGMVIFLLLWTVFYFLFFVFLNKALNNHLKNQIEIFQLLGGHIFKLKLIRALIIIFPLIIIWILSFVLYYLVSKNLIYFFPFLNFSPNFNNFYELLFFTVYFIFLIIIYPLFIIFISFKRV